MAEVIGTASNSTASFVTKEYPVASGVTVTDGDFVYLTSGRVTGASITGVTLLGLVQGGQSNDLASTVQSGSLATTGDASGTKKVLVVVDPSAKFIVKNDNIGTTFAATHVGQAFDVIGATGAQLVDTSTVGATGQLECVEYGYQGDITKGIFIINEHKYKLNAQEIYRLWH